MERLGWIISDNSHRQEIQHSFCRPPTAFFLLLKLLFHFRPFLLNCSSGTSDDSSAHKVENRSVHLQYVWDIWKASVLFLREMCAINQISLCSFSFQKKGGMIFSTAEEPQFKGLPRKNSSVDTIHLYFCATDTLKL